MSEGNAGEGHRLLAGRYRLLSVVGRGGMGTVWRARDEALHRDVAVKEVVLDRGLSDEERADRHERTLREARASARLGHPGVVTVHDVVDEDGRPWIVMELVDARSLQEIIDGDGPLPPARAADIGRQVMGALRAAHAIGILHRDVKPANVLVTRDGRAVLTDFGIAQFAGDATLTRTGLIMGSPAYMSPERVKGERALPASDVWALGATLYAAVEGRPPHHRTDAMAVLAAVMTQEPPPPRNAGALGPVLYGLLERDPARRTGAAEAEEALARVASGAAAPPPAASAHVPPPVPVPAPGGGWGTGQGTLRIPDQQIPVPHPATAPVHQPGGGRRRPVVPVLAGVGVAAAVALAAAVLLWPDGGEGDDALAQKPPVQAAVSATPAESGTPSAVPSSPAAPPSQAAPPAGMKWAVEDGYRMPVPIGWRRSSQGNQVSWTDPVTQAYLLVDTTTWENQDPYQHWVEWEPMAIRDGKLKGFQRLGRTRTSVGGAPAADLEYTWLNGVMHARSRGVAADGRNYVIMAASPVRYQAAVRARQDAALDGFRPA
ncbi:serine/threonine-protein kinase [Actinomadura parmotrematis]|uniref:non-specific serine/threonine protein kinase n=1 Tax=Actinomadura parmotrematis TaxID=2864039 RepID=A0ABS7FUK3_9ACTN|nr:serine/threonine-protein kinase [Actinomadura parmotrematis]MBW8484006.1 protein kinase [Actinomadura parmotrematis]